MNKQEIIWNTLSLSEPTDQFVNKLKNEWMLITAGSPEDLGTMTINWGGSGFIWNRNIIFVVIRESRNTLSYLNQYDSFSLSFFDKSWQEKLLFCGRNSGRDVDKIKHCGFTPEYDIEQKAPFFLESEMVLFCKKIVHTQLLKENFIDEIPSQIWENFYNTGVHTNDKHHLFIASIEKVIEKSKTE